MKKFALSLFTVSLLALTASAAEMTGYISDAECAKTTKKVTSDEHESCAKACAKRGAPLVFVTEDGKVYKIDDQAKVADYIGDKVTVTGEIDGEHIKVDSVKK